MLTRKPSRAQPRVRKDFGALPVVEAGPSMMAKFEDTGCYLPTEAEIVAACELIRSGWDWERANPPYETPVLSFGCL